MPKTKRGKERGTKTNKTSNEKENAKVIEKKQPKTKNKNRAKWINKSAPPRRVPNVERIFCSKQTSKNTMQTK